MTQDIHRHRLLILDFGSQYTQLIARRIREVGVYCEIIPWDSDMPADVTRTNCGSVRIAPIVAHPA